MNALPILLAVAAASAIALLVRGVFLGYPPASLRPGARLSRKEQAIIAACADALFPPGGPIPISGTEAGLVGYMEGYVGRLPFGTRALARLLFHFIEHAPWIFGPRRARFTRLSIAERRASLLEMNESGIYFRRVCFISMRAMLTMGYLANPGVAQRMHMVADPAPFEHAPHARRTEAFA